MAYCDESFVAKEGPSSPSSLLSSGRRLLALGELPRAASLLSEASQAFAALFGDTGVECGEAHLEYGWALLHNSRMEAGVLEHALEGVNMEEEATGAWRVAPCPLDIKEQVRAFSEALGDYTEVMQDGEEDMEAEGSETSDLQLAWEMLELARIALTKKALVCQGEQRREAELRVCSALQGLGEVSYEGRDFLQARGELSLCLERRKELLPGGARLVAETHYMLGMAEAALGSYSAAVSSLQAAVALLEERRLCLGDLEEVKDLEDVIREILDRIVEYEGMSLAESGLLNMTMDAPAPMTPSLKIGTQGP